MAPDASNPDCLFCRLIAGEIPCERIYEDSYVLAFLDIQPVAPGHTLVIPKKHYPNVLDLPAELGMPVMHAIKHVGSALMDGLGAQGFNVVQNNLAASGQTVFHVHWHVIPRTLEDGFHHWPTTPYAGVEAMRDIAQSLRDVIRT